MPKRIPCTNCGSSNKPDAVHCHSCGRALSAVPEPLPEPEPQAPDMVLKRVMGGEVYSALVDDRKRPPPPPPPAESPPAESALIEESTPPDDSDVLAVAMERIRAKAHQEGHRFKPYVRSKSHKGGASDQEESGMQLDIAVGLLRERRFEEAIEPLLKAIARDDENRRPWILLGEAYLRVDRAFKAAVAYFRALELSPT